MAENNIVDNLVEDSVQAFIGLPLYDELTECIEHMDYERELIFRGKSYSARELFRLYRLVRLLLQTFAHNLAMIADQVRGDQEISIENYLTELGKSLDREGL